MIDLRTKDPTRGKGGGMLAQPWRDDYSMQPGLALEGTLDPAYPALVRLEEKGWIARLAGACDQAAIVRTS